MARYIDADALIEKIKAKATEMFTVDSVYEYYMDALIDVEDIIKAQPTADVVPTEFHDKCMRIEIEKRMKMERKKGEWIKRKEYELYYCSVCGKNYHDVSGFDFCPNCGADMRGNNNDN